MGFSLDHVLDGQDAHYAEYTCAVCFQLVDAPLLTRCQHVFCTSCLQDWFANKPSCPTCSTELDPRHGAGELKLASPFAHRVLGRLRVRCTMPQCTWVGEYSEISAHLTSSESHQSVPDAPAARNPSQTAPSAANGVQMDVDPPARAATASESAEALKAAGNSKFEQRIYPDAIVLYTKAIQMCGDVPTYYCNRAAAYFMSGRYSDCVSDCQSALKLDPSFAKAYKRLCRAYCELGEFEKAVTAASTGARLSSDGTMAAEQSEINQLAEWQKEGEAALSKGDPALARTFFANMLAKTNAPTTRLWLVRAELGLGLCDRALRTTREVIKGNPNMSKAYVLRSMALLYSADLDQAQKHLREALRLDPDDAEGARTMKKVRKLERHMDAAKQASVSREFEKATVEYTEALQLVEAPPHAPLSASLHAERAAAHLRLKCYDEALRDCAKAIYAQDDHKPAWLTKAQALHALGRHAEAHSDMQHLSQTFQNDAQVSHALNRAAFEVRKERRPDYYGLLKVPTIASSIEIKSAYKQRALEWHPDKHTESTEAKEKAEVHFKLLGEALEILTDDFQRKLYNEGYDKEAIAERVQAANRAASNHNKDGCCSGGGGCHHD